MSHEAGDWHACRSPPTPTPVGGVWRSRLAAGPWRHTIITEEPPNMDPDKLHKLTDDADRQHRAGMVDVHRQFDAAHFSVDDADKVASRRQFLRRAGTTAVVVGAVAVPFSGIASSAWAQGGGMGAEPDATTSAGTGASCATNPVDMTASDEQIVIFAESVERAAVAAYQLVLEQPVLGTAASQSSRIFASHHGDHAEALRCLLGGPEQAANEALVSALVPQITEARTENALIELLLQIEAGAAATYFTALGSLQTPAVAGAASTILPVEAQHEVVWSQYLGLDVATYVPAFQTGAGAFAPA